MERGHGPVRAALDFRAGIRLHGLLRRARLRRFVPATFADDVPRYNPSGGKDQVSKYMDLSKDELILARKALADVLTQMGYKI